jgi:GntR family transcriptional regulator
VINQSADSYFTIAAGERNPDLLTGRGAGSHIARISAVSPDVARFVIRADMAVFDYRFPVPH